MVAIACCSTRVTPAADMAAETSLHSSVGGSRGWVGCIVGVGAALVGVVVGAAVARHAFPIGHSARENSVVVWQASVNGTLLCVSSPSFHVTTIVLVSLPMLAIVAP